jgi:hypothetical protein
MTQDIKLGIYTMVWNSLLQKVEEISFSSKAKTTEEKVLMAILNIEIKRVLKIVFLNWAWEKTILKFSNPVQGDPKKPRPGL